MTKKRRYFGTDGIRGTVGSPPITPDFILRLSHAVGRVLKAKADQAGHGRNPVAMIGKDTRISGYMIEAALESGLNSAGVDVVLLGPLPTPGVAYLTRALRADLGVVISASHNPYADNGIKFFSAQGSKLPDSWEMEVEAQIDQPPAWVGSAELGRSRRLDDASGRYIEFCKSTFDKNLSLKGLRIVVDAAHGAAYHIAPDTFHELGAQVFKIGCEPNGLNINHDCGATHPAALVDAVQTHKADFGIALDGDADRLQVVDANGRLYNGDELLYAMLCDRLAQNEATPGVVGTLMTNKAIENALHAKNVALVRANVGDRYVLEALEQRGWLLGGESSGHLLALDKHSTGDGLISALQVLQLVVRSATSLSKLLEDVQLYPQTMINVRIAPGSHWADNAAVQAAKAKAEQALGDKGRVLLRASGTEPVVRVMVEAEDAKLAQQCSQSIAEALHTAL